MSSLLFPEDEHPIPALQQQQDAMWMQIVQEIAQIAVQDDKNALSMGDRFVEIERRWGRNLMKIAAQQSGVGYSVMKQRYWVSSRIAKESSLRVLPISWTHLRALAGIDSEEERVTWAEKVVEGAWTVKFLLEQMEEEALNKSKPEGPSCIQCESGVEPAAEEIIHVREHGNRYYLCGTACAETFFHLRRIEAEELAAAEPVNPTVIVDGVLLEVNFNNPKTDPFSV